MKKISISILILVHNAPQYVEETLLTLNEVTNSKDLLNVEIIVLDNASNEETKKLLREMKTRKYIDKLFFSDENTFFAKGNNIASTLADQNTSYYLLLNSDVKIIDPNWLSFLLENKEKKSVGIASYGYCHNPSRADGYCFLIDKKYYDKYLLDQNYQWWWGITKLQACLLKDGVSILAFDNHNHIIYHYGGKSGKTYKDALGLDTDINEVISWFMSSKGKVIMKSLSFKQKMRNMPKKIFYKIKNDLKKKWIK